MYHLSKYRYHFNHFGHYRLWFISLWIWIGLLWTLHITHAKVGPDKQYFLVKDLSQEWWVYDELQKEYVPYVSEQHANQLSVSILLDLESNRNYQLLINTEKDNYLFFNNSLKEILPAGQWRIISIDSLYKTYRVPQLMITLYGTPGQLGKIIYIAHRKATIEKLINVEEESFLTLKPRQKWPIDNFFVLGILLMGAFIALIYNGYQRAFERMFNLYDLLQINVRDESFFINKPFNRTTLLFITLLSLEISYLYMFAQDKNINLFSSNEILLTGQSLAIIWFNYFKISLLCFAGLIFKYIALYLLGTLYRLENIANLHYFKILQSSILFYTALILALSLAALYLGDWENRIKNTLLIPSIIFYALRTVLLFFIIRSHTNVKNLYLISYLCIVELIPLIIGVRYAL
ncbi:MAG: DUF4271 domain-containing protein [Runella sp.]